MRTIIAHSSWAIESIRWSGLKGEAKAAAKETEQQRRQRNVWTQIMAKRTDLNFRNNLGYNAYDQVRIFSN